MSQVASVVRSRVRYAFLDRAVTLTGLFHLSMSEEDSVVLQRTDEAVAGRMPEHVRSVGEASPSGPDETSLDTGDLRALRLTAVVDARTVGGSSPSRCGKITRHRTFRGGLSAVFSVEVLALISGAALDIAVQYRNAEDTTWTTYGSAISASTVGVHTLEATGIKEEVCLRFSVQGSAATDTVYANVLAPQWRPY